MNVNCAMTRDATKLVPSLVKVFAPATARLTLAEIATTFPACSFCAGFGGIKTGLDVMGRTCKMRCLPCAGSGWAGGNNPFERKSP